MATPIGSLYVALTADVAPFARNMRAAEQSVGQASASIRRNMGVTERSVAGFQKTLNHGIRPSALIAAGRSFESTASRANLLRGSVFALTAAFGGLGAALTTNVIARYFDTFTNLENQMRVVSKGSADLAVNIAGVTEAANRSRVSLSAVATLYSRISKSAPEAGAVKTLRRVETITKALQLGGATAQEAASAAVQFSQAIASNRLGGEELRAVLETPLGLELAKGLGVTIGKFREMGYAGELTANVLFGALDKIQKGIDEQFSKSVATIDQSLTVADNALTAFAGKLDDTYGITKLVAGGIMGVANNLDILVPLLGAAGAGLGLLFAARRAGAAGAFLTAPITAVQAINAERKKGVELQREEVRIAQQFVKTQQAGVAKVQAAGPSSFAGKSELKQYQRDLAVVQKADADHMALLGRKAQIAAEIGEVSRNVTVGERRAMEQLAAQMTKIDGLYTRQKELRDANTMAQTRLNAALGMQATNTTKLSAVRDAERGFNSVLAEQARLVGVIGNEEKKLGAVSADITKKRGASFAAAAKERAGLLVEERRLTDQINKSLENRSTLTTKLSTSRTAIDASGNKEFATAMAAARKEVRDAEAQLRSANTQFAVVSRAARVGQVAVTAFAGAFRSLYAFLGGPWGVALIAATTALGIFSARSRAAAEEHARAAAVINETLEGIRQGGSGTGATPQEQNQAEISAIEKRAVAVQENLDLVKSEYEKGAADIKAVVDSFAGTTEGGAFGITDAKGRKAFTDLFAQFEAGTISLDTFGRRFRLLKDDMDPETFAGLLELMVAFEKSVKDPTLAVAELQRQLAKLKGDLSAAQFPQYDIAGPFERMERERQKAVGAQIAAAGKARAEGQELLRIFEEQRMERDRILGVERDIVSAYELAERTQDVLNRKLAKTREDAEAFARVLFGLEGRTFNVEVAINASGNFLDIMKQLQGVPPGLIFDEGTQLAGGAGSTLSPLNPTELQGPLPRELNTDIFQREQYGRGREAARAEIERQRKQQELLDKAADTGNKALNTSAKIAARGQELLEQEIVKTREEAEKLAAQELNLAEAQRLAAIEAAKQARETKKAATELEKFENMIKELKATGEGAFLTDLDRDVLQRAERLKDGSAMMRQYIDAINSGDLSKAPQQLLAIRDALMQIGAADTWRDIVQQYGTATQLTTTFADKQRELNFLVSTGRITAGQASLAWADFLGQFRQYAWIDSMTDAFTGFAESAITDFENIEDAFKNLLTNIAKIILQETVLNPLKDMFRSFFSNLSGGGATGGAGAGGGLAAVGAKIADSLGFGGKTGGQSMASAAQAGSASKAVDLAGSLLGASENANRSQVNSFLKAGGVDLDAAQEAWCAGFVNSSLKQVGVTGSGSNVATNFLDWGQKINPADLLKGDVLVQGRGLSAGQTGGHVGFATGLSRTNSRTGSEQFQMLSGNYGNKVNTSWVDAAKVDIRRATEPLVDLGKTAAVTTESVGGFGQGIEKLSTSFFPAAPNAPAGGGGGGGGLFGGLFSKLFGGFDNSSLFTGFLANFNPASAMTGLFHGGGKVGAMGGKRRSVLASAFSAAPRLHAGHMPFEANEFPAVLEKGEQVLTRAQGKRTRSTIAGLANQAARGGGGSMNFNIDLGGSRGDKDIEERAYAGTSRAINEYDKKRAPATAIRAVTEYNRRK